MAGLKPNPPEAEALREAARRFSARFPIMGDVDLRARKGLKVARVLDGALRGAHPQTVLDVGCSNCIVLDAICQALAPVYAIGIDMDESALASPEPERAVVIGDAQQLPIRSETIDVVICNHTYEHVPDAGALFREIERVLKPDGIVYFAAMNARWPIEPHYHLPFLHWLPHALARLLLRLTRQGGDYLERPLGTCGLRRLVAGFKIEDYTLLVIAEPERYGAEDVIPRGWKALLYRLLAHPLYGLLPGYIWVLRKR